MTEHEIAPADRPVGVPPSFSPTVFMALVGSALVIIGLCFGFIAPSAGLPGGGTCGSPFAPSYRDADNAQSVDDLTNALLGASSEDGGYHATCQEALSTPFAFALVFTILGALVLLGLGFVAVLRSTNGRPPVDPVAPGPAPAAEPPPAPVSATDAHSDPVVDPQGTAEEAGPAMKPRSRTKLVVVAVVALLLLGGGTVGIVVASQPNKAEREAAYLKELRDFGWIIDDAAIPRYQAIGWGYQACGTLDEITVDSDEYLSSIQVGGDDAPTDGDKIIPHAAGSRLCPEHSDMVSHMLAGVGSGS